MKQQSRDPYSPAPIKSLALSQRNGVIVLTCLLALLGACNANRTDSNKGQRLRLNVGDINEISMVTRQDTTWQLTATSDNQEVVDVSRKPLGTTTGNGINNGANSATATGGSVAFLIKGVTAGTARVVFSEKPVGEEGAGRVKKTYVVTVVNK
ncbi:MAG: hypothetical protein JWP57_948 [Spirosoma sp.]|nr:hypothetical protein [Spirosoma sp.]